MYTAFSDRGAVNHKMVYSQANGRMLTEREP
jgi:hypothetical protein